MWKAAHGHTNLLRRATLLSSQLQVDDVSEVITFIFRVPFAVGCGGLLRAREGGQPEEPDTGCNRCNRGCKVIVAVGLAPSCRDSGRGFHERCERLVNTHAETPLCQNLMPPPLQIPRCIRTTQQIPHTDVDKSNLVRASTQHIWVGTMNIQFGVE